MLGNNKKSIEGRGMVEQSVYKKCNRVHLNEEASII